MTMSSNSNIYITYLHNNTVTNKKMSLTIFIMMIIMLENPMGITKSKL